MLDKRDIAMFTTVRIAAYSRLTSFGQKMTPWRRGPKGSYFEHAKHARHAKRAQYDNHAKHAIAQVGVCIGNNEY